MSVQRLYLANLLTSGSNEDLKTRPKFLEDGKVFSLETFYKANKVEKILKAYPNVKILLDSGAHTLIHEAIKKGIEKNIEGKEKTSEIVFDKDFFDSLPSDIQIQISPNVSKTTEFGGFLRGSTSRSIIDWSYFDTKEVKNFLERYVEYINRNQKQLYQYVNLDVIFNPERTWDHQKYLESCGLNPIPVYHFGEDLKWLKKYMDNYDYIGIGGLGQDITKEKFVIHHGDPTFKLIRESKQDIKTHGFAVTSLDLMLRYNWYSVDSTSWVKFAAYGTVLVPRYDSNTKKYDYSKNVLLVSVSYRTKIGIATRPHFTITHPKEEVQQIQNYFKFKGWKEEDLENNWNARVNANITYYRDLALFLRNHKGEEIKIQKRFF